MSKAISSLTRIILTLTCLVLLLGSRPVLPSSAESAASNSPGEDILLRVQPGIDLPQARRYLHAAGYTELGYLPEIGVFRVTAAGPAASPGPTGGPLASLRADSTHVRWAEPNGLVHASDLIPNDPYYQSKQSYLALIGLPAAWDDGAGSGVTIAIIDTGIDLDHPDLAGQVWTSPLEIPNNGLDDDGNGFIDDIHGWNFVGQNATPQDDQGHGSHVAGIAGAATNNSEGIAGVAWQARLLPVKILDSSGSGTWENLAAGIIYAANQGAKVINLSLGGTSYSQTLADAVTYAQNHGCLVVAAAGNSYNQPQPVDYPAALSGVLAVAATGTTFAPYDYNQPWSYSNQGPQVAVSAPGVNIYSTYNTGGYVYLSGTSMATPHVSGLAALLWSLWPNLTPTQIHGIITAGARDIFTPGFDERTGSGEIDAPQAVAKLLDLVNPQISLSSNPPFTRLPPPLDITLTATVRDAQGKLAPDGVRVTFSSADGSFAPASALTHGGQAVTTFTAANIAAQVNAEVYGKALASLTIDVLKNPVFLPVIGR